MEKEDVPLLHSSTRFHKHSWKKILVSGVGFFSDAYDLFVINIVMLILSKVYSMELSHKSAVSAGALWGAIGGQIFFGFLADKIGRKKGFLATLTLVILGAIASSLSFETTSSSVFVSLAVFRLILGFGIGGEYPLSATITAESSKTSNRGRMTAAVFSMQGVGSLTASLTGYVLIFNFGEENLDLVWRLCLGFGAIPGILTMYWRIRMEETEHFVKKTPVGFFHALRTSGKTLMATAACWFLLDIVFYANGLFSSMVVEEFEVGHDEDVMHHLLDISKSNVFLALIALPGYWVGIILIEAPFFGRRNTQIIGFILLGIAYICMGGSLSYTIQSKVSTILMYGITFFFANAGPNTTTFVLPSESFPTNIRATCHGISAACGKLGAVVGATAMAPILSLYGVDTVLYICGGISFLGAIVTMIGIKETKGHSLEELVLPQKNNLEL